MFAKKNKKENVKEIVINLETARSERDVNKIVAKALNIKTKNITLDSINDKVKNMDSNTVVSIVNPKKYENELIRYVLIIKSILYGFTEMIDPKSYARRETIRYAFLIFIAYSFVGWLVENFVEIVINGWTYMPREFLRGPLCPIFGIGALILLITLDKPLNAKVKNIWLKLITIFIESTLITSLIEFLTSYYLEYTTGTWPWKGYANQVFNLGGRIALQNSLGFGLISTIGLVYVQPWIEKKLVDMKYNRIYTIVFYIIWTLFLLDVIFAMIMPTGVRLDVVRQSWR